VDRFAALFVCTGNICRSPTAQFLLTARLAERLPHHGDRFTVGSAGTLDLGGEPMEPLAVTALAGLGVPDGETHRSRQLARADLDRVDLVLGMTRQHRGAAIQADPRVAGRAFTLREFARYCRSVDPAGLPAGDPVRRARAIVAAAALRRGLDPPPAPDADDLLDPLGAPAGVFSATATEIAALLEPFLQLLAPGAASAA
jgi:protein-tyrosine phosphatase